MRTILFRGKRKDNGQWAVGGIYIEDGKYFITYCQKYIPDTRDWDTAEYYEKHPIYKMEKVEVIPKTVGQFTGLFDKNSKQIFEGDVVKTKTGRRCVVCWFSSPSFCGWDLKPVDTVENVLRTSAPSAYDLYLPENLEVIGNIHDNPELLKQ
ncbi:MAG: hypothetical protein IJZ42_01545 [Lachnospiraceae bacterium]|nr:hypothetical protein [Lachnospiraceae bacterium]